VTLGGTVTAQIGLRLLVLRLVPIGLGRNAAGGHHVPLLGGQLTQGDVGKHVVARG
jgi:hypothetical protein